MASRQAQKRLAKEYKAISVSPPPYIIAKPNEENILEWHYVITGPANTPFEDGQYHGILRFPNEYPFKPPSISMVTPNGRFACNTRLCLSMSDYHPDTWNPAWSVATILNGLLSFMTGTESTTGSINTSEAVKRKFSKDSRRWNLKENDRFVKNFPELVKENKEYIAQQEASEAQVTKKESERIFNIQENLDQLDPEDKARLLVHEDDKPPNMSRFTVVGVVLAAVLGVYFSVFRE